MNILTSLLSALGAKKGADNHNGTWTTISGDAASSRINEAALLEANSEWVFVAVDKVARGVSGVRLKAMRYQRNGDDQEVFSGPLVDFLESPAEGFTGKKFAYLHTVYKELTGNALWERLNKRQLKPLIPTKVTPVIDKGRLISIKYEEEGKARTLAIKDFFHDRYLDPARPAWGKGKLAKIVRWVDTSTYLTEFLSRFFENGATFGGFIETEEETEQRIKLIKAGLQNDHVGIRNAHKIGVLPKGSKYAKVTANMSEMEMGATDDRYRDKILAAFGVPKSVLGLVEDVNRANAEASEYVFAKYTIEPIVQDLIEFLNESVLPMLDSTGKFYFAYDEFVPENMELKLKEREIALNKQPYMTVNEVRASVGLPPVEGGDIIYSSPGTPIGQPLPAPVAPAANDDEDDAEPKKAAPRHIRQAERTDRALDGIVSKALEIAAAHHDPDAESHRSFVSRVEQHEERIAQGVRDFNNRQEREVVQNLKRITKAVKKGDLYEMEREVGIMVDFMGPLLRGLMLEQAVDEFVDQAFPGVLDPSAAAISRTVDLAARRLAKSYNTTTANLLTKTLNEGIDGGEDLTALTERVRQLYEFSDRVRAERVAKTEAFYIANEGSREAYRQSGVVKSMRWYTAEDERVCPFCGPLDGKVIGVNEAFYQKGDVLEAEGKTLTLDYRTINVPPLHTSCRCFIRPESIELG